MALELSICIPTYNRKRYLEVLLNLLIPQVELYVEKVEIVIVNNASTDDTNSYINSLSKTHKFIRVFHNTTNIGFDGNTIKCIQHAKGKYAALLSDDDVYLSPIIPTILNVINVKGYCLICLNYYSFNTDFTKISKTFVSQIDKEFSRGYEIINYPTVGHFSGFVYNTKLALQYLNSVEHIISTRLYFLALAVKIAANSNLPSFYIGKRLLAVRISNSEIIEEINVCCINYYKIFYESNQIQEISQADLKVKINEIMSILPRKFIKQASRADTAEIMYLSEQLNILYNNILYYKIVIKPLIYLSKNSTFRVIYRKIYNIYKKYKLWRKVI